MVVPTGLTKDLWLKKKKKDGCGITRMTSANTRGGYLTIRGRDDIFFVRLASLVN